MIHRTSQSASAVIGQASTEYVSPVSGLQYFICMIDYGPSYPGKVGPSGFGADVAPEQTRRQIVEDVRDLIENGRRIVHVRHCVGTDYEDVTHEIVSEALALKAEDDAQMAAIDRINDRIAFNRDRARDYAKETVA